MMRRDPSPISFPNTYRDSNDIPTAPPQFPLPSAPPAESMSFTSQPGQSIVRPVDFDRLSSPSIASSSQSYGAHRPATRSIIRTSENDDGTFFPNQLHNQNLIRDEHSMLEASGYDANRASEIDADAEYALQLQQEEYTRESLAHPYLPFQVETDEDSATAATPSFYAPDNQHFSNDYELAARLQQEESRSRQQYRRTQIQSFPIRQRPDPADPTQVTDTEQPENELFSALSPFAQGYIPNNEDDDESGNVYMNYPHPFFQMLASRGRPLPGGFSAFLSGLRGRAHRRSGNLQDTEEDFGPEDYERLLQLDDTVRKKKLTKDQINSIPMEQFSRTSNNSEEETKCGVCLEFFEGNETLRRFPCRHVYHKECADRWLLENNVCPICREPPITGQPIASSRHHRGIGGSRRPPNTNRNPTSRSTNNHNPNNNFHNHNHNPNYGNNRRRGGGGGGPGSQHPS